MQPFRLPLASLTQAGNCPEQRLWDGAGAGQLCRASAGATSSRNPSSARATAPSISAHPGKGTPARVSRWRQTLGPLVHNKHKRPENAPGSCHHVVQHSSCPEQSPRNTVTASKQPAGDMAWLVPPCQLCRRQHGWQGLKPCQGRCQQLWRARVCVPGMALIKFSPSELSTINPDVQCSFATATKH